MVLSPEELRFWERVYLEAVRAGRWLHESEVHADAAVRARRERFTHETSHPYRQRGDS